MPDVAAGYRSDGPTIVSVTAGFFWPSATTAPPARGYLRPSPRPSPYSEPHIPGTGALTLRSASTTRTPEKPIPSAMAPLGA